MLKQLSVQNFALIDQIEIDFAAGLSVITGETGAGKSILLGALSLILGNRADHDSLKDKSQKCIIEATFKIEAYDFFSTRHTSMDRRLVSIQSLWYSSNCYYSFFGL